MPAAKGPRLIVLALLLLGAARAGAATAPGPTNGTFQTPAQAYTEALRQSIGAPARASLGPDAFVRLSDEMIVVPHDQAVRLLTLWNLLVPPDLVGLLLGPKGMNSPGIIRFVATGFVDAGGAATFTADDLRSSLSDTIEHGNPARLAEGLPAREF